MLYPIIMYETLCARQGLVQPGSKSRFTRHEVLKHWGIGKLLFERKLESRYGEGIVRRLSGDLKEHFPQMGLSTRQLWNMKAFYIRYKDCDNFATTLLKMISCVFEEHQAEDNVFVF